jgi:hypothetical protein
MPKLCVVKGFLPTTLIRFTHVHADVSVPTPPYGAVDTSRETPCFCRFVTGWGVTRTLCQNASRLLRLWNFAFLFLLSIVDQLAVGLS